MRKICTIEQKQSVVEEIAEWIVDGDMANYLRCRKSADRIGFASDSDFCKLRGLAWDHIDSQGGNYEGA